MNSAPFWEWVNERHAIYIRKALRAGADPAKLHVPQDAYLEECDPEHFAMRESGLLTRDAALAAYSFCNVFRELDRVTQWIDRNIRQPFADHPDLWMMLAIARYINWPGTLQFLMNRGPIKCDFNAWPNDGGQGLPHFAFSPEALGNALDHWSSLGQKVYTGAYMIRAESNPKAEWYAWTKQQYVARIVLGRLWEDRNRVWVPALDWTRNAGEQPTLQGVWNLFQHKRYIGWGPFMAYQVVVDLRHTRYLRNAPDINTWAALGPGSRRGLNRLSGRPVDYPLNQAQGLEEMRLLWAEQDQHRAPWVPPIELSDIQNCLCEVDKHMRVKTGEGKPRSLYIPGRHDF
jgi:hypothetical protein